MMELWLRYGDDGCVGVCGRPLENNSLVAARGIRYAGDEVIKYNVLSVLNLFIS